MNSGLQLIPLQDFPLVEPGQNLGQMLRHSLEHNALTLEDGDILVLAQKIVSKAEGRYVKLSSVTPSPEAEQLARDSDKDPRQAELILRESREVIRVRPGVVIVEHNLGYVHANAGIDKSNIPSSEDDPQVLLLPLDSDASAEALLNELIGGSGLNLAIIINDSAGRAWRNGTVGMAIGCAGIEPVTDQVGDPDLFGRALEITEVAVADELAAAASFVMGQADEGCPVVLIRGAKWNGSEGGHRPLLRPAEMDMFR
jgi:coenzyme F420-0:L-glutamate ligase / coenzyme F420-1:gamma-L-glutamate ligase